MAGAGIGVSTLTRSCNDLGRLPSLPAAADRLTARRLMMRVPPQRAYLPCQLRGERLDDDRRQAGEGVGQRGVST